MVEEIKKISDLIDREAKKSGLVKTKLEDLLFNRTVEELKDFIRMTGMKGYSKLKKAELVDFCYEMLKDEEHISTRLTLISNDGFELFEKAVEKDFITVDIEFAYAVEQLLSIGLIYEYTYGYNRFIVPDEIKQTYLEKVNIHELKKFRKVCSTINDYAIACTNLYGVIEIDEFIDLIIHYNVKNIDEDIVLTTLVKNSAMEDDYFVYYNHIVHESFEIDDFETVQDLLELTDGKKRHLPSKSEFLKYVNEEYYEPNLSLAGLEKYFVSKMNVEQDIADDAVRELGIMLRFDHAIDAAMEAFNRYGIEFSGEQKLNEVFNYVVNAQNSARKWSLKGQTPYEVTGGKVNPKDVKIINTTIYPKISRNAPCPCGSGKKFKHCCGK